MASFSSCSSTEMTVASAPNWRATSLDEFAFKGLVDGDEDALHQEAGDEVLAADVEFFREVLDRDAFRDRDGLGDGQGARARWTGRRNAVAAGSPSSGLPSPFHNAVRHGVGRDVRGRRAGGWGRTFGCAGCSTGPAAGSPGERGSRDVRRGVKPGRGGSAGTAARAARKGAGGVHGGGVRREPCRGLRLRPWVDGSRGPV